MARTSAEAFRYLSEDVVSLAEDPAAVSIGSHQQLHRADVDVTAQGPEVRLLQAVDTLQLLHLNAPRAGGPGQGDARVRDTNDVTTSTEKPS